VLLSVGLMRVVAEGGVYWLQIHSGPFHLAKTFGLAEAKAIPAAALAPLMAAYSLLFLDIKAFLAPSIINSFKMQDEVRAARRRFHLAVVLAIVVTLLVGSVVLLYITYGKGADRSSIWFFSSAPRALFNRMQRMMTGSMGAAGKGNRLFYLLGAGWVATSMLMRRRFFWWLHPIGFIMLVNPLMTQLSFPFFIGWLCKKLAVKYGGRHTFARMRPLFIGLILAELTACFFWALMRYGLHLDQVMIDINRTVP
jgi:membrane glycosyltransferase